jgi:hypothetical protein
MPKIIQRSGEEIEHYFYTLKVCFITVLLFSKIPPTAITVLSILLHYHTNDKLNVVLKSANLNPLKKLPL